MPLSTVIFGSIGAIAETSELQRRAFNEAFEQVGLDLRWEVNEYRRLLQIVGGRERLRQVLGDAVDDATLTALHEEKTRRFQTLLENSGDLTRDGLRQLLSELEVAGVRPAIASTTYRASIDAILRSAPWLGPETFGAILSLDDVAHPKPHPEVFERCLEALGVAPEQAVAIEDTGANVAAPKAAGIRTVAVPGAYAGDQDFSSADLVCGSYRELTVTDLAALLD